MNSTVRVRIVMRFLGLIVLCLNHAVGAAIEPSAADVSNAALRTVPSSLLAIDQNRSTVIDRIVGEWGDALVKSNAGIDGEQLRALLGAMRADQLLAASLAGSLEGLRNVIAAALVTEAEVKPSLLHAKALGDAGQDIVYVPVTPCRLVETRGTFAAVYQGGGPFTPTEVRSYKMEGANGVCLSQLPVSPAPSAAQVQVFAYPTTTESGDVEMLPYGATFGSTSTMVYLGNNVVTTVSATTLINQANKQISVQVRGGGAHLVVDVVGYFRAPLGGFVSGVTAGTGLTGGTITSSGTIAADTTYLQRRVTGACAAGTSIRTVNADGTVACEADDVGTGTVTSVGSGTGLTGGPITTSGTLSADTTYLQRRVSSTCSVGSSIRAIAADGTVTCQADGPANAYVQGGNAFGATAILGTTDDNALDVRVNGARAMRFEPSAVSPNVIGGSPANNVTAGVRGATIAGGGTLGTDPDIGIGAPNRVTDIYGTVSGGFDNRAGADTGTTIDAPFATVGGGLGNIASARFSTVGGGVGNFATGNVSAIGGGLDNAASAQYSVAGGGYGNIASGFASSIAGGFNNIASGQSSTVAGGALNTASGDASFAAGSLAIADAHGCFVWNDNSGGSISCGGAVAGVNRVVMRATGGFIFLTHSSNTIGAQLLPGANAWSIYSDREYKDHMRTVDARSILDQLVALPIATWNWKSQDAQVRHMGPTAQDFHAAFALGETPKMINTVDVSGVALAAIQGLNAKLEEKVSEQASEIAELRRAVEVLMARTAPDARVAAK